MTSRNNEFKFTGYLNT